MSTCKAKSPDSDNENSPDADDKEAVSYSLILFLLKSKDLTKIDWLDNFGMTSDLCLYFSFRDFFCCFSCISEFFTFFFDLWFVFPRYFMLQIVAFQCFIYALELFEKSRESAIKTFLLNSKLSRFH